MIGVLEMPGVVFGVIDGVMPDAVPDGLRVVLWGLLAGVAGMLVYRRCSPQARLLALRRELAAAQSALMDYDGPPSGLWPLLRRQLGLALGQMRLSLVPSLLAGLPVILMWTWLMQRFDTVPPVPDTPLRVWIEPAGALAPGLRWMPGHLPLDADGVAWLPWPQAGETLRLLDDSGRELARIGATSPRLGLRPGHWDWLLGKASALLPADGPLDALHVDQQPRRFLPYLPNWLAGWEALFIAATLAASLLCKWRWRLQ